MHEIAHIFILDIPYHADKEYSYFVPSVIRDSVLPGVLVEVPFGKSNRRMTGVVVELTDSEPDDRTKPITRVLSDEVLLTEELLGLCKFVKEYTLCTFGEAVRAVLPSGAMSKVVTYYRIIPADERVSATSLNAALDSIGDRGRLVYELASGRQKFSLHSLQAEFDFDCTKIVAQMVKYDLCEKCTETKGQASVKTKRIISVSEKVREKISLDPSYFEELITRLRGANQKKILLHLRDCDGIDANTLFDEIGVTRQAGKNALLALEEYGLIMVESENDYRNRFTSDEYTHHTGSPAGRVTLSDEQRAACDKITALYEAGTPAAALLHGVTGSGKTNVIMECIEHVIRDGRGVIMLIPEIALTPQTVGVFMQRFGERIAVIHSSLSAGERFDAWRRIRAGEADVVIGTRSAIFAPLPNIGMIIIDEEHEYTYKSDTNPKYHAHDIARRRCRDHNAVMVLSSATPSISSYYKARTGTYTLVELKNRFGEAKLPTVEICDMRGETARGNLSPIGEHLASVLREDKKNGNQSILFLNRRGYNNYVSCRTCGHSIKCPNCSVTLTYHSKSRLSVPKDDPEFEKYRRENGYLVCHTCGYKSKVPEKCPDCGGEHFLFMGCGTQRAEDDIIAQFPDLRVLRMDFDTTQKKESHEEILGEFRRGEADVLLGTQMVTKGHDFPRVATVGVLSADSSLTLDDYRAGERTFAMLTQVIGRAGRADVPGRAIIQTYNPTNEVILMAARQDYERFYEGEIKLRRALMFPPFCDIAVITLSSADEGYLGLATNRMYERIKEQTRADFSDVPVVLYGPFEAPVYRVQNVFRMRFVMKCRINRRTREFFSELISEFAKFTPGDARVARNFTKTSRKITVSVDLNPSTV